MSLKAPTMISLASSASCVSAYHQGHIAVASVSLETSYSPLGVAGSSWTAVSTFWTSAPSYKGIVDVSEVAMDCSEFCCMLEVSRRDNVVACTGQKRSKPHIHAESRSRDAGFQMSLRVTQNILKYAPYLSVVAAAFS
jgi:hypothetical protein